MGFSPIHARPAASRKRAPEKGSGATMNTYEIVTERIINLLEQGVIP
jgi:antirestriction protein ArdC